MIDASKISFSPIDLAKWLEGAGPGDTNDAFDQLATRVTWTVTAIKTAAYTANDRELVRVDPS